MSQTLIIDSFERSEGTATDFKIQLSDTLRSLRSATLLFASVPTTDNNIDNYYMITISEFSASCINAGGVECTYVMPISSVGGSRSLLASQFPMTSVVHRSSIDSLTVRITDRLGEPITTTNDTLLVLSVS